MTNYLGLDTSSKSVAFAIIDDKGNLVRYGQYYFEGENTYQRLTDAMHKTNALMKELDADYVCIEEAVRVLSISTAIVMAKFVGVVVGVLGQRKDTTIVAVQPLMWQAFIGNPNLKKEEKTELLLKHREIKTENQKKKFFREYRKKKTISWVKEKFDVEVETDDISDAIGLAWFCSQKLGDSDVQE